METKFTPKCVIDQDGCVQLSSILEAFNAPIKEEQCWALYYQLISCLNSIKKKFPLYLLTKPAYVYINKDGYIHKKTFTQTDGQRRLAPSLNKLFTSIGTVLFLALDYGLDSQEERSLDSNLELLIDSVTCDIECTEEKEDRESNDEGIERDSPEDEIPCEESSMIKKTLQMCICRLGSVQEADLHYKAVCRALVTEGMELSSFLQKIVTATDETRTSPIVNIEKSLVTLDGMKLQDWSRLWMQVIRELRQGVKLKKVSEIEKPSFEFELTPYEMLLDDIRSRKYKLNKVIINGATKTQRDVHDLILDFIRSRPPLVPLSNRKMPPPLPKEETLYERLMASIKKEHKLRPTPVNSGKSSPVKLGRVCEGNKVKQEKVTFSEIKKPSRKLIKANITIKLSLGGDDDDLIQVQYK